MGTTYQHATPETEELAAELIRRHHPQLFSQGVTIDILMAHNSSEESAVMANGYPAFAMVRIVNLKDRAKGCRDAEIVIDAAKWEFMPAPTRSALLDHELQHLKSALDRDGNPDRDDLGRPKLKLRKHDIQIGWFACIAERHGMHSIEMTQAREMVATYTQSVFAFLGEPKAVAA